MKITAEFKENREFEQKLRETYTEKVCDIIIEWIEEGLSYVLKKSAVDNLFFLGLVDRNDNTIEYTEDELTLEDIISRITKEMEYALDENGTESRDIIEEEYKLLKETLEGKNKLEYIYTVFKVYETLNDTISTNFNIFKSKKDALKFFHEFKDNHIKDFRLDKSDYGYDKELETFYTHRGMEDLVLYLTEHPVSKIDDNTFYIVALGIKEVDEYLQGNITIFESKEEAESLFDKEVHRFIEYNGLNEDDYFLSNYHKTFSMRYDLDIENGEKSDFCVDIIEKRF